jgi:hypothetical protein
MQERKFQLKTNISVNFQENTDYQDAGGVLVFVGKTLWEQHITETKCV